MAEEPEIVTTEDARAGESRGKMRYVLAIGTVLAVVVLAWLAFGTDVASQSDNQTGPETGAATGPETGAATGPETGPETGASTQAEGS